MIKHNYLLFALYSLLFVPMAQAAPFLSQYGQIQNVSGYSSNPYWSPNRLYNQRIPKAVYVNGADLTTADCQAIVSQMISSYCGQLNNCAGLQLSDIKPKITVALSQMSDANYVGSCAGFIDTTFTDYTKLYGTSAPAMTIHAPITTSSQGANFQIQNPYEQQMPKFQEDEWGANIFNRRTELENLQSQNGGGSEGLAKNEFPAIYADLSFTERMAMAADSYAPYADASAYQTLKIETDADARARELAEATHRAEILKKNQEIFCAKNPTADECRPITPIIPIIPTGCTDDQNNNASVSVGTVAICRYQDHIQKTSVESTRTCTQNGWTECVGMPKTDIAENTDIAKKIKEALQSTFK